MRKKWFWIAVLGIAACASAGWVLISKVPVKAPAAFGVTFSLTYAEKFDGVDGRAAYLAILDDLAARHLRIPAYWSEIEKTRGIYDFFDLDWQIAEAERREADIILAVGQKLPRWPECHLPDWAVTDLTAQISSDAREKAILAYIKAVIERYKHSSAIIAWQVENEPFLPFGECPTFSRKFLDEEITLVRSLDPERPVITTDSGELSIWIPAARRGDWFGTTMYRTVWNAYTGHFTYPIPPSFFRLKRALIELAVGKKPMIVIELQGEPWQKKQTYEVSVQEQYISMNPEKFKETLEYASRSGFDTFYLWGVEWWWWLKTKQDKPEMWIIAREVIRNTNAR